MSRLYMLEAYGDMINPTRTTAEVKFDVVYVVIVGNQTCRPHVITRYQPVCRLDRTRPAGVPYDAGMSCFVDCLKAVYDGEILRTEFYSAGRETLVPRVIPNFGYSTMKWKAEEYADELYRVMQHHTNLHYPDDVVEAFRHVGRRNYCEYRKGLWTRHFPTWKCLLALTALKDAAAALPLQLEFRD